MLVYELLITTIYLQNTTSVVSQTLLLLELLFEVHIVRYTLYRLALIQLELKYVLAQDRNSEIRLRYSDNNTNQNQNLKHETSNLDVPEEIFTLLTMNNLKDVETSGLIDFSLILGNLIHTYLSGSLAVSNIWYRGGMTNFILFSTITKYSYVIYNQYLLLIPIFIDCILIFFKTLSLPNRLSVNLFAGSLIINILTIAYTTFLASLGLTAFGLVINFYEIFNPSLQLLIFSLLTMEQEKGIDLSLRSSYKQI